MMRWKPETRYQMLLSINNAVVTQTTRDALFDALSTELKKHFAYDRFSINLYDPDSDSISYFAAADGIRPDGISEPDRRSLARGAISRMVIRAKKPVVVKDLCKYRDLDSVKSMVEAGLTATMAFPLIIRNRIFGSMHFSFKHPPDYITELTQVLTEVSQQVAIGVENMLTYTSLEEQNRHLARENRYLIDNTDDNYRDEHFICADPRMAEVMKVVGRVAETDIAVLITGETGTGKDYIARFIHRLSPRRNRLFVKTNCPALTASLFESELFGHAKGAFTGADAGRTGRFETADGGTLFLDEVGELPASLQAKLLHVLQDMRFERVGESRPVGINCRIVAATNRDLTADIQSGRFRKDLYYRLNIVNIHLPPLRERPADIPELLRCLNASEAAKMNRTRPVYTDDAVSICRQYSWPGNVRELKNLVKRMVILHPGETIGAEDITVLLPESGNTEKPKPPVTLADAERTHILRALIRCKGAVGGKNGAAALLGIPRTSLQYRIKKAGLHPRDYAGTSAGD